MADRTLICAAKLVFAGEVEGELCTKGWHHADAHSWADASHTKAAQAAAEVAHADEAKDNPGGVGTPRKRKAA